MVTKLLCIEIRVPVSRYVSYFWYKTVLYRKYWRYVSKYFWYTDIFDTRVFVYRKNDTYCNMYQKMYHIFDTWYNMYQKNDTWNYTWKHRVNIWILIHIAACTKMFWYTCRHVSKFLVHIDNFWYILSYFLICIAICIIFLIHGFGTRKFWYTNRKTEVLKRLKIIDRSGKHSIVHSMHRAKRL